MPESDVVKTTTDLITRSDSTILILFFLLLVGLWILAPRWGKYVSTKNADQTELITVIKQNTEAYVSLKVVFEQNNSHCDSCKAEQMIMFTNFGKDLSAVKQSLEHLPRRKEEQNAVH